MAIAMGASGTVPKSRTAAEYQTRRYSFLKAEALIYKATTAISSSELLLDSGDFDGACNRAYYAMFDAARAALIATASDGDIWRASRRSSERQAAHDPA